MAHLRVKELEPGMVLRADVCDQNGRFLVGAGCELSEKHIKALLSWGVVTVEVEGDGGNESLGLNNVPDDLREEFEQRITERFKHTNIEHPFMAALLKESIDFQLRKKLEEEQSQ